MCLCDVIATDLENVWLVSFKILPGFRPPLNGSFNMKFCRAIWRFIIKSELYGFIILYETINVIKHVMTEYVSMNHLYEMSDTSWFYLPLLVIAIVRVLKGTWKCARYVQLPFIYRFKLCPIHSCEKWNCPL
jgi:hypothetical protein